MDQEELELQLQVWKDLAINKQMLIRTVTDALEIDPECSSEELKESLAKAVKQVMEAETSAQQAQEQARTAISVMEKKMAQSEKAQAIAESAKSEAETEYANIEQQIAAERAHHATELKKLKTQLADKQRALKEINVALADTPENVIKKLKALKKQKFDESTARKQAEGDVRSLRKEKQQLEQRNAEQEKTLEQGAELAAQYRELFKLCESLQEQLKPSVENADDLPALPELPEELLQSLEPAGEDDSDEK